VRRTALALVVLAAMAAPAAATSYPTHVGVALTRSPGNTCCAKYTRASVSAKGVLTQSTMARGGSWKPAGRRHLKASELTRLRSELRKFNPAGLKSNTVACHGPPIGDVGGYDLRVGTHESNCPPKSANALVRLLTGWLPKG
jgi:hypothetical protein